MIPQNGLENKTVIPIAIGGSFGHLLSIEYALKPVISVLGATEILKSVFVLDQQVERLDNGKYQIADEAIRRLDDQLQKVTDRALITQ